MPISARSSPADRGAPQPRLAAALMGTLVKGVGQDRIVWGTDGRVDRRAAIGRSSRACGASKSPKRACNEEHTASAPLRPTSTAPVEDRDLSAATRRGFLPQSDPARRARPQLQPRPLRRDEDRLPATTAAAAATSANGFVSTARLKRVTRRSDPGGGGSALRRRPSGLDNSPAPKIPPTQPVSKEAAQYQDTPKGLLTCSVCTFFRALEAARSSPE